LAASSGEAPFFTLAIACYCCKELLFVSSVFFEADGKDKGTFALLPKVFYSFFEAFTLS